MMMFRQKITTLRAMVLCSALLGTTTLFAARERAAEPVTFSNKTMSLTVAPDGGVSLKRDGEVVSDPTSLGWSVYNWTDGKTLRTGTRTKLDNMMKIGPNKLMLWSSKKHFEVKVAITPKDRYFTFELLHVSNDPKTGDLNGDWQGHRVEFEIIVKRQSDGWLLNTLPLNPMSEINTRSPNKIEGRIAFKWPYAQWAQTDDRPQPQGLVAAYGFVGDEEYNDILIDIWVGEPSAPRPNRKNLKSWTRSDVKAWLDRWNAEEGKQWFTVSFSPNGPESLYKIADYMEKAGFNRIYIHHYDFQGKSIGLPNGNFPNGMSDVIKWREYCDARGIKIKLHGFGGLFRAHDIKFGTRGTSYGPDSLAKSARGFLVSDVAKGQTTFLVKPDLSLYPWLKPGMLPSEGSPPWGRSNSGYGTTFPPYYEKNQDAVQINKSLYYFSAKVTKDNLWEIDLGEKGSGHSALKAGDRLDFIAIGTMQWLVPDPRSKMYEEMADDYANILNHFQSNPLYDGAGMSEPLGTWGLRKMSQMVYERLDHPSDGYGFGHFDQRFKRINKYSGRGGLNLVTAADAVLASSLDDVNLGMESILFAKDICIRGNHRGINLSDLQTWGLLDEMKKTIKLWSDMEPYISNDQKNLIADHGGRLSSPQHFFVASESDKEWHITKTRAMRREGIDLGWQHIPERPPVSPRQFLKPDGKALEGLHNPYGTQTPEMELHVLANMKPDGEKNVSLMPKSKKDIVWTDTSSERSYDFSDGKLMLSVDNSKSQKEYNFTPVHLDRVKAEVKPVASWSYSSIGKSNYFDMSKHRGFAITVEGDGSGSVLFVRAGSHWGRNYPIEIDFVGKRTIEIPNGEAHINRYGFVGSITAFNYSRMDKLDAFIQKVPAGKKETIIILDIKVMHENHNVGLIDPVLTLNSQSAQVRGTIPYDHYLTYSEGPVAKVYDPDWKFVKDVPVTAKGNFEAVNGNNTFSVKAAKSPDTFLSSRIKVKDLDSVIRIKKPQ